jgi:hypothetical protein
VQAEIRLVAFASRVMPPRNEQRTEQHANRAYSRTGNEPHYSFRRHRFQAPAMYDGSTVKHSPPNQLDAHHRRLFPQGPGQSTARPASFR